MPPEFPLVAADPLRPELGTQKVAFEYYPRTKKGRPSLGTLVGHEGGPGYPTTGSRDWYLDLFAPLSDREKEVLRLRYGLGTDREYTLEEIGQRLSVTRERVRQIESRALQKVRAA